MINYTAQEYLETYVPGVIDFMNDPAQCHREMTQEAAVLSTRLDLGVSPEGRYRIGIWDEVMSR